MRLQYMQTQVEEAQAALARKHLQQQELQERAEKAEANLLESQQKLYNAEMEVKNLKGVVEVETKKRKQTELELQHTQINLKKTLLVLDATKNTESSLTEEAIAIISTLEKVIGERNEFHSLVTSQMRKQSGQKAATKQFQKESLELLDNIESSLAALCKHIESKQNDGVEAANLSHEVGRQFVNETQKLVEDIANNVSSATDRMKTQLQGENGLAMSVDASTKSISSNIQATNDVFAQGEKSLTQTCGSLSASFSDCAKMLNGKAAQIESSTNQTLQNFEAKISESKEAMLSLVMRLKGSLSKLSEAKTEKTDELNELLNEWKEKSLGNSQSITDTTATSMSSLKATATHFKEELSHHDAVSKALSSQKQFVDSQVVSHVNDISTQNSSLLAHRDMIAEYNQTQTNLCNQVMQSIVSSVQNIVKSELGKLSSSQTKYLQVLDSDGAKLADSNQRIKQSAEQVMSNIQSTNLALSEEANVLMNNDLKVSEQLQSTQNALEQIATLSSNHQQLTSDYSSKNISLIEGIKQLDSQNSQIAHMVERDGNACSKSLVSSVLKPTSAAIKKTAQSSLNTFVHVDKNVLQKANETLQNIAAKRQTVSTELGTRLQAVGTEVQDMSRAIFSFAESQNEDAAKMNETVTNLCNTHQQTSAPYFVAELAASKQKILSTIKDMSDSTASAINQSNGQNVAVKQSIQDFALNKMQINAPAPSAPTLNKCNYSTDLSSTPAEEEILKGHNFNPLENGNSTGPTDEESNDASSSYSQDVDVSQDTNDDDDNKSIMSSGSMSVSISAPSPGTGLKSRDINVCPPNANANKSRKHSRPNGASKKNKIPSGLQQPSESRKRMRM